MSSTNSLLHALKDQIRNVKYSIRAEAHMPGSMVPRALQSREVRRLTSLGSVVSMPAFRLADGLVSRVETIAMDLLGTPPRGDRVAVGPVDAYLADHFEFVDRMFALLKSVLDAKHGPSVFVAEQGLDSAWGTVAKRLPAGGLGVDPALASAVLAVVVGRTGAVRQLGYQAGATETNFTGAPALYCALVAGLMIAVASARPEAAEDGAALLESADSAVDARFDRFRRALAAEDPAEGVAAEYRKLVPFLP